MALTTEFLPYIFGGNTGETPESIAKKRAVAEAIMARGGTPKNVGEGLTAVGDALASVILERRAAAAEKEGQAGAGDAYSELVKLLGGDEGGGDMTGGVSGAPSPVPAAPTIARPPSAGTVESVPAGWGAGGSSAPPAGSAQPTGFSGGKQAFVDMLMPAAVELGKKIGLDPRLIIGQAAQETGFGAHAPGGNYFGIKSHGMPGGQSLRTTEYAGGVPRAENASFRTYSGPEASVRGYGDFLQSNPRYGPMLRAQGLDAQLAELGRSGYATDPNYAASVGAIARGIPQGGPTQVASLDPSIGLPPAPTAVQSVAGALPGGGPPAPSPGVATVAAAMQGGGGVPAGPEMASAAPFSMGGANGLAPPFVPPSVPTGIQSGRPTPMMPTQALSPSAPPPRPGGAPPPAMGGGVSPVAVQKALEVLNHPFSNAVQKAQALEVLKMAQQQRDPAYQMGLEEQRLKLDALKNPKSNYGFQLVPGLGLIATNPATGRAEKVMDVPPDATELTPEDRKRFLIPPDMPGYKDAQGQPHTLGSPSTTVNVGAGETGFDKTVGEGYAKSFLDMQGQARSAQSSINSMRAMQAQMQDPSFFSGDSSDIALKVKRVVAAIGLDPKAAASMEDFNALAKGAALAAMGGSLGTGFSNADRDFVEQQTPNLGNTPEGNRRLLDINTKIAERKIEIAAEARKYAASHNNRIDAGFDDHLEKWAKENQLFPAVIPQGGYGDAGPAPKAWLDGGGTENNWKFLAPDQRKLFQ